jgi:hypothetical protein
MLHFASLGISGVNLHGGGNGWYSPIVGSPSAGFARRPEFFGIQFAQKFAQTTLLRADLQCTSDRVSTWAAHRMQDGRAEKLVALVNKTTAPAIIRFTGPFAEGARWAAMSLSAPSLEAKTGIEVRRVEPSRSIRDPLQLRPHSALLLTSH